MQNKAYTVISDAFLSVVKFKNLASAEGYERRMVILYLISAEFYALYGVKVAAAVTGNLFGLYAGTELFQKYTLRIREKIEINSFGKSVCILAVPAYL